MEWNIKDELAEAIRESIDIQTKEFVIESIKKVFGEDISINSIVDMETQLVKLLDAGYAIFPTQVFREEDNIWLGEFNFTLQEIAKCVDCGAYELKGNIEVNEGLCNDCYSALNLY